MDPPDMDAILNLSAVSGAGPRTGQLPGRGAAREGAPVHAADVLRPDCVRYEQHAQPDGGAARLLRRILATPGPGRTGQPGCEAVCPEPLPPWRQNAHLIG